VHPQPSSPLSMPELLRLDSFLRSGHGGESRHEPERSPGVSQRRGERSRRIRAGGVDQADIRPLLAYRLAPALLRLLDRDIQILLRHAHRPSHVFEAEDRLAGPGVRTGRGHTHLL